MNKIEAGFHHYFLIIVYNRYCEIFGKENVLIIPFEELFAGHTEFPNDIKDLLMREYAKSNNRLEKITGLNLTLYNYSL